MDFRQQPTYISIFPRLRTFVYDTGLVGAGAAFSLVSVAAGKKPILYQISLSCVDASILELRGTAVPIYRWHIPAANAFVVDWFPHGLDVFVSDDDIRIFNAGAAAVTLFMSALYIEV